MHLLPLPMPLLHCHRGKHFKIYRELLEKQENILTAEPILSLCLLMQLLFQILRRCLTVKI